MSVTHHFPNQRECAISQQPIDVTTFLVNNMMISCCLSGIAYMRQPGFHDGRKRTPFQHTAVDFVTRGTYDAASYIWLLGPHVWCCGGVCLILLSVPLWVSPGGYDTLFGNRYFKHQPGGRCPRWYVLPAACPSLMRPELELD